MNAMNSGPSGSTNNTRTIANNSLWSGIELFFSLIVVFVTSVAVANVVGKDRLSYFQYVAWLTNVTMSVGSFGIPATTRKYMAEYLNRGQAGVARAIYLSTLKLQVGIVTVVVTVSLIVVLWRGDPHYLAASVLMVLAMSPRLVSTIPSQANNAAEVLRRNTGPSLAGCVTTTILTIVSLMAGWDLIGVAGSLLVGSVLECALKLYSVERWLGGVERGAVPSELGRRMFAYSGQGMALLLLNIVVWDRSDMVILKALNNDPGQVTFFSIAFNLVDRVLTIPTTFGGSLAATMMAQFGRGQARLKEMTVDGGRYALLVALPLLVGMACLSQPLVRLLYRPEYQPLAATLTIVALMALPKALMLAPTMLLQVTERQGFLIVWGCLCGAIDIGLDILLVGQHGANGAALANGTAQTLAAIGIWIYAAKTNHLDLKFGDSARILASGAIMALGVIGLSRAIPGYLGTFASVLLGAAIWMIGLRFTAALQPRDISRFLALGAQFPSAIRPYWNRMIAWLAPAINRQLEKEEDVRP